MRRTGFTNPDHTRLLASPAWLACETHIKAFEDAWQRGATPAVADFLHADGHLRRALLIELVHVDLEFRIKAGESACVERYLDSHPELAGDERAALDLIAAEFEFRQRQNSDVDVDEYRRRFPALQPDLGNLLASLAVNSRDTVFGRGDTLPGGPQTWPIIPGYEIIAEIGRGGMGIVYRAREPNLSREVALKILPADYAKDPDRLGRFLREARTASGLNHPHICTIHALGDHQGCPFIVMELIEGTTLQTLIAKRPAVEEAARVIRQAARALAAAHAAGVVHRDIKPENVMVRADGYVKVLDFGLARRLPQLGAADPSGDTDPGALIGTVRYMSPEQAQGTPVTAASDMFALGILLYQLTTGVHPFDGESSLGILYAIVTSHPPSPARLNPQVPSGISSLIEAMLHKDARLRPTAAEVEAALAPVSGSVYRRPPQLAAARPIVRREPELAILRTALHQADAGRGRVVCLAGEPGIGKSTLVEDFIGTLAADGRACLVARGHCSERLADTEAYLPVIDALEDWLRGDSTGSVARLMKLVAPSWYAQLTVASRAAAGGDASDGTAPAVSAPAAGGPSQSGPAASAPATSQQGLLREFRKLVEETARLGTLVLFFDDVHWADAATVDLLAHLGRHSRELRLLLIATFRPTELLLGPHVFHGVKQELQAKGLCTEVSLGFLGRADIDRYLALAFPNHSLPAELGDLVYARTEGSPLFMVDLLRYLRERGVIGEVDGRWTLARGLPDFREELPESVRSMIQRKLERLDEADRRLLAAASVRGTEFDAALVAGVLNLDAGDVEERLQMLDRVHGIVRAVREHEFPDRTLTMRFAFVHILYQQALYNGLTPARRTSLSAALARALEGRYGAASGDVAADLACLYEVGRDFERAAQQFCRAAQNAARVFAHRDAIALARRGLALVTNLPDTPARAVIELPLQTTLGLQLQVTDGFAAPAAARAYHRARELCDRVGDSNHVFPVLWGLWLHAKVRSDLRTAQERADELLALARRLNDPDLALQAHQALGVTALCYGAPTAALRHVEQAAALYDPARHRTHSFLFGQDPGIICKAYGAVVLWLLGYPEQAQRQSESAIDASRDLSPSSQAVALHFAAMLHQMRRDPERVRACTDQSCAIAAEHGFSFWLAGGNVLGGWAQAASGDGHGGLDRLRDGLRNWAATDSVTYQTYYLGLLAEVLCDQGRHGDALTILDEALALARQTDEGLYEAELHRLRGEAILQARSNAASAEADFREALELARRRDARALQLRAAVSLARLAKRTGTAADALIRLSEAYLSFTEGFDTPELHEARTLCCG